MLKGKVAIITGSSSGIGAAIARKFVKDGVAGVTIHGRNESALQKVRSNLLDIAMANGVDCKVHTVIGDIREDSVRKQLIKGTIEEFGRLDILVNNAGITQVSTTISAAPVDILDELLDINVRSLIQLTQSAIPYLITSGGNIVNIGSLSVFKPKPQAAYYGMSKAALDSWTRCLSVELGPKGVRVNGVSPGYTEDTNILSRLDTYTPEQLEAHKQHVSSTYPLGRPGTSAEVADLVAFVASDRASFVAGHIALIDGGVSCL